MVEKVLHIVLSMLGKDIDEIKVRKAEDSKWQVDIRSSKEDISNIVDNLSDCNSENDVYITITY